MAPKPGGGQVAPPELEGAEGAGAGAAAVLLLSLAMSFSISAIFFWRVSMLDVTPSTCSVTIPVISALKSVTDLVRALSVSSIFLSVLLVNSSIRSFWEIMRFFMSFMPLIILAISSGDAIAAVKGGEKGLKPLWH